MVFPSALHGCNRAFGIILMMVYGYSGVRCCQIKSSCNSHKAIFSRVGGKADIHPRLLILCLCFQQIGFSCKLMRRKRSFRWISSSGSNTFYIKTAWNAPRRKFPDRCFWNVSCLCYLIRPFSLNNAIVLCRYVTFIVLYCIRFVIRFWTCWCRCDYKKSSVWDRVERLWQEVSHSWSSLLTVKRRVILLGGCYVIVYLWLCVHSK